MILNEEQLAAIFDTKEDGYLRITKQALESLRDTITELKRQLRERDEHVNEAQSVVYFSGVKHGAEIALRDAAIIASQINHEAASAIADLSSDSCVELQKKSAKLVPFVQALDAHVQERVDRQSELLFRCIKELDYVQSAEDISQCASGEGRELIRVVMAELDLADLSAETWRNVVANRAKPGQ